MESGCNKANSPIEEKLDTLWETLTSIGKSSLNLEGQLASILSPLSPCDKEVTKAAESPIACPLELALRGKVEKAKDILLLLESINKRVRL